MKLPDILAAYSRSDRSTALATATVLIASIAVADSFFQPGFSLGFLYLIPILVAALYVSRTELLILAAVCTFLREVLGPFDRDFGIVVRSVIGMLAYFGSGLFVEELALRRRRALNHLKQLEEQVKLRQDAEEQLRVLVETSPAAILTVAASGKISLANDAARQVFAAEEQPLVGESVGRFLPCLADVSASHVGDGLLRTALECRGRRRNGEVFPAHIWLSTYDTASGPRMAAIVLDVSEELRDREELGLNRLMESSRILVRAVSHEIRNACAAIGVVHSNMRRFPGLAGNEDFKALGTLVEGLGQLVSTELRSSGQDGRSSVDLQDILAELRIIIEPSFTGEEMTVEWIIPDEAPAVYADRHGLLHVFMNLATNSLRALQNSVEQRLTVAVTSDAQRATVRFIDTGPGVARPDRLFQPFQQSADGAGLGLYLSRALVRSFAGELRHEPRADGCCFAVELARFAAARPVAT